MAIQEQSWRPKESPEAAKLSLFHFQLGAGFVIETWPCPCKKAMWWCQEVKLNRPVLNCVVLERHSYRYLYSAITTKSKIFAPLFLYDPVGWLLQFFTDRKIMY